MYLKSLGTNASIQGLVFKVLNFQDKGAGIISSYPEQRSSWLVIYNPMKFIKGGYTLLKIVKNKIKSLN